MILHVSFVFMWNNIQGNKTCIIYHKDGYPTSSWLQTLGFGNPWFLYLKIISSNENDVRFFHGTWIEMKAKDTTKANGVTHTNSTIL